ncbi:unnamed protein product [Discosporangium mesarthrocarpum]
MGFSLSPFNQVIEILSVSLDKEKESADDADFNQLAGNPLHKNIQRQLKVCSGVVKRITVEHHSSLNSSLQAMGGVARHYNQTRANVGNLREQLRECKQLLQTGVSQTDVRELWQRKIQYGHVLKLLDALSMIKDAPAKFDRLVRQKRFVAAVGLLNASLLNIFSPELVDVPAVASVRDEMLAQKGQILDLLVKEIADVLFLRTAHGNYHELGQPENVAKGRRRRERGSDVYAYNDDTGPIPAGNARTSAVLGGAKEAVSEPAGGGGNTQTVVWAGLSMDVGDVGEEEEQDLEDPSQDFNIYLRLLVEAVRRLRYLDDVERYLIERLPKEILTLSATHMRACLATGEEDKPQVTPGTSGGISLGGNVQRLVQYLGLAYESFVLVLVNHVHLVRLLHDAHVRDLKETDTSAPVFGVDVPYKEALVLSLWQHIQTHIKEVLARHIAATGTADNEEIGEPGMKASDKGLLNKASSAFPFRQLRRPESLTSVVISSPMVELDAENAEVYCRNCFLAEPSPFTVVHIFRPTLKFVEAEQGKLKALKKEILGAGQGGWERGRRREAEEGYEDDDMNGLYAFLHRAVEDNLLPKMSEASLATNSQVAEDPDSFFPRFLGATSGPGTGIKHGVAGSKVWPSVVQAATTREGALDGAELFPSKGVEEIYAQARFFFRALVQMPHYGEQVSDLLRVILEKFFMLVRDKFQDLTDGSMSRLRLERSGDKLRGLLKKDRHYLLYKTQVYGWGAMVDHDAIGKESNSPLHMGQVYRNSKSTSGLAQNARGREHGRPRAEISNTTAEEEADDVFETEFMLLKDLWKFDAVPYPVTKKNLLSLRKQQAVACLVFSCDWLAHKLLKMCNALQQQQQQASSASDGQEQGAGLSPVGRRSPPIFSRGFRDSKPADTWTPIHKLSSMKQKFSQLADDGLLCLRLEVFGVVTHFMQQMPAVDLGVDSGKGSTTAMSLGSVEDQCIVDLNRCIREEHEAFSPIEPKGGGVRLICPRELLQFMLAPLPRLVPRLFVHSLRYTAAQSITVGGVGKLNKIVKTLQQTIGDAIDSSLRRVHEEGSFAAKKAAGMGSNGLGETDIVTDRFGGAAQYIALISMTQGELENFIRNNRTKFTKEEYRVQWLLAGPNRRSSNGGRGENFEGVVTFRFLLHKLRSEKKGWLRCFCAQFDCFVGSIQ